MRPPRRRSAAPVPALSTGIPACGARMPAKVRGYGRADMTRPHGIRTTPTEAPRQAPGQAPGQAPAHDGGGRPRRRLTRAAALGMAAHVFYELAWGVGMPTASVLGP